MTFFTTKKPMKSVINFLIEKAEQTGYTAVKFPYGKTNWATHNSHNSYTADKNGVNHYITGTYINGNYYPYKLFSKNFNDEWQSNTGTTNYVTYDFGTNNPTVVNAYYIQAPSGDRRSLNSYTPKKWTFYGSNVNSSNNTDWTVLDMREGSTEWRNQEKRYFKFSNTTPYRYYKLDLLEANNTSNNFRIAQMEFFDMADLASKPQEISAAYLVSKGSSTFDNVNLYLDLGDCYNNAITQPYYGNYYHTATIESFNPATLEQRNMMLDTHYLARSSSGKVNNNNVELTLYTDITKDRIVFATVLDPSAVTAATNVSYIGLMKRYSNEGNNAGLVNAVGMYALYSNPSVMRNKAGSYYQQIIARFVSLGYSPSVWGDNVFVSPVFLEGDYEGIRGELEDVYTVRIDNLVNEDEVLIGSVRYKVLIISSAGSCSFPHQCVVFKLPNTTTA